MDRFILHSEYEPTGDQPEAIKELVKGFEAGDQFQTRYRFRQDFYHG